MTDPAAKTIVPSIQAIRGIAATMVLVFHANHMANAYGGYAFPYSNAGAAGVDIFFVVSGFVIAHIGGDGPATFLRRRLVRVAPPYWLFTTLMLTILVVLPAAFTNLRFDVQHILMSYGMLLSRNNQDVIGTLLGVGWTICFELYFYGAVAAVMVLPRRYRTACLTAIFVAGAVLERVASVPPAMSVVASALPLEFLAGYLLAEFYRRGALPTPAVAACTIVATSVLIVWAGAAGLVSSERDPWRVIYFGLPACGLVLGILSLEARAALVFPAIMIAVGDASYSLYLSHQFLLYGVGKFWTRLDAHLLLPSTALILFSSLVPIAFALIFYRWIEKPMNLYLSRRLCAAPVR